jgi:hypothetical protein
MKWSADVKRLILEDLRVSAKQVLAGLRLVSAIEAPAWLQSQARQSVAPYVRAGGNEADMMFWFGTVLGAETAKLASTTEFLEMELPR